MSAPVEKPAAPECPYCPSPVTTPNKWGLCNACLAFKLGLR